MARAPRRSASSVPSEAWAMLGMTDLEATTCWDFPTQSDGHPDVGDASFNGVTPARCVSNLVRRYTRPGELVVDPMAGSGTIGAVACSLGRRAVSFDLAPRYRSVFRADAREWPLRANAASLAVVDSPYSDNIVYGPDSRCLGRISCREPRFYEEMARVSAEPGACCDRAVSSPGSSPTSTAVALTRRSDSACSRSCHTTLRCATRSSSFATTTALRPHCGSTGPVGSTSSCGASSSSSS